MLLLLFVLLNVFLVQLYYSKRYHPFFLLGLMLVLFVEPVFQKLTDATLYGDTFHIFGLSRMKTNLVIIISLIIILLFPRNRQHTFNHSVYIFLVIIFHVFNVLFSINTQNSFALFLISIILPILIYKVLMTVPIDVYNDNILILRSVYMSVVLFMLLGLTMYFRGGETTGVEIGVNRTGGGIWLSNVSTQVLALFFPLVLIKSKLKLQGILRIATMLLFGVLLIISLSRMALFVYTLMILLFTVKAKNKGVFIMTGIIVLGISYYFMAHFLNINLIEIYSSRFEKRGDLVSTVETDARFIIYDEAIKISSNSNNFIGTGISTFNELNRAGFSNAHNIFLNVLVERGIAGIILVFAFFFYLFKKINFLLKIEVLDELDRKVISAIKIGIIGFLLIGITGNDLFLNSGFINSWPISCLIICLAIIENKILIYKRR